MQVWYRTVSLVKSSEFKENNSWEKLSSVTLRLVKNFRGWRLTTKIMKLNQPRKFLRIRYYAFLNFPNFLPILCLFLCFLDMDYADASCF